MSAPVAHSSLRKGIDTVMDATVFQQIAAIAQKDAGLVIAETKMAMVQSRLARRLRALKLHSFGDYLAYLESEAGRDERGKLVSALTTNVSHFFRENHHFDLLRETILPDLLKRANSGGRVRIWSAGCSNGQEPYSIAMTILGIDQNAGDKDIRILATDIDSEVVAFARAGRYAGSLATGLESAHIEKFTDTFTEHGEPAYEMKPDLKKLITFRELNLHDRWPMTGKFDIIFCRNVVIYFDEDTQSRLYRRYAEALDDDGWLFLGHSERINDSVSSLFKTSGVTAYRPARSNRADVAQ